MKKILILTTVICMLLFSSCASFHSTKRPIEENSEGTDFSIERISLEEYEFFSISDSMEGFITNTERKDRICFVRDFESHGDGTYHDIYLLLETTCELFKITIKDRGCYASSLYVCDIDGDSFDEIILQQTMGITGGNGQYLSRIFKINGSYIEELFHSDSFDTGYYSTFSDGFCLNIINRWTSEMHSIKYSERYVNLYFNNSGNVINHTDSILCDSFYSFEPIDIDQDGIFEISCIQYVSLNDHSDYIGDAQCILKYNPIEKQFKVVQSDFSPVDKN